MTFQSTQMINDKNPVTHLDKELKNKTIKRIYHTCSHSCHEQQGLSAQKWKLIMTRLSILISQEVA